MPTESDCDVRFFFLQRDDAWIMVNILLKGVLTMRLARSACRECFVKRQKGQPRSCGLVRIGVKGVVEGGSSGVEGTVMCETARE